MLKQGKALQGAIDKINRCMKTADRDFGKLCETREALSEDKEDKDNAINLDVSALQLKLGHGNEEGSHLQKKVRALPNISGLSVPRSNRIAGACQIWVLWLVYVSPSSTTGDRAKVREFESKRNTDFRPRFHISLIRLRQNTGDTSATCRIFELSRFSYFLAVARRLSSGITMEIT